MSTVLWTNLLENGVVRTDDADKIALYRHTNKLDAITRRLAFGSFASLCDTTDMRFNLDDTLDLPEGMSSTTEMMARDGAWFDVADAVTLMQRLIQRLREEKPRFGFLTNDYDSVLSELEDALSFARSARENAARFNFCVVM